MTTTTDERGTPNMLEPKQYVRKPFPVLAAQVSSKNITDIATWSNGQILSDEKGKAFVKIKVAGAINDRQKQAYVGDWVLLQGTSFKIYTHKAFLRSFEEVTEVLNGDPVTDTTDRRTVRAVPGPPVAVFSS